MLDVSDFVLDKGGDPNKVRESQRRRHAPEDAVDQVIALYEDHRKSTSSLPSILYQSRIMLNLDQPNMMRLRWGLG